VAHRENLQADAERYRWLKTKFKAWSPNAESSTLYSLPAGSIPRARSFDEACDIGIERETA
jgi:hypothetical protein